VKKSPGRIAGSATPAKPGDECDLPALCTNKLFRLSHKSGLIHSIDSVWTVKRGLQAVDPSGDGSSSSITLTWVHQVQTSFKYNPVPSLGS